MKQDVLSAIVAAQDQWSQSVYEEVRESCRRYGEDNVTEGLRHIIDCFDKMEHDKDDLCAYMGRLGKLGCARIFEKLAEWKVVKP